MIDEELVSPQAFALAVQARASYLARHNPYSVADLRPYSQLTLLLGVELEDASEQLHSRGLRSAYRWAVTV